MGHVNLKIIILVASLVVIWEGLQELLELSLLLLQTELVGLPQPPFLEEQVVLSLFPYQLEQVARSQDHVPMIIMWDLIPSDFTSSF